MSGSIIFSYHNFAFSIFLFQFRAPLKIKIFLGRQGVMLASSGVYAVYINEQRR